VRFWRNQRFPLLSFREETVFRNRSVAPFQFRKCDRRRVMGIEGIVAKRRHSRYRSGRCREWIEVKNRAHPAFERAMPIAADLTREATPAD
jgi:hypothetical protein